MTAMSIHADLAVPRQHAWAPYPQLEGHPLHFDGTAGEAREEEAEMIIIFQLLFGSWHDMENSTAYIPMAMMIKQDLPPMLQYGVVRLAHVNSTIMPTTSVCIIQYTHTATVHCTAQTLQSTFTRRHLALHSVLCLFSETTSYFVSCFRILELETWNCSCWVEKHH